MPNQIHKIMRQQLHSHSGTSLPMLNCAVLTATNLSTTLNPHSIDKTSNKLNHQTNDKTTAPAVLTSASLRCTSGLFTRAAMRALLWTGVMVASTSHAATLNGDPNRFYYKDWELVCDNTLTCRAAGYQSEQAADASSQNSESLPISVLLTRAAGAGAAVTAQVQIGDSNARSFLEHLPKKFALTLYLAGQSMGTVNIQASRVGQLSGAQTQALLQALKQAQPIEWVHAQHRWRLSSAGSSAVLLKMDALQGRVNTPSALIRKGNAALSQVKNPIALSTINKVVPPTRAASNLSYVQVRNMGLLARLAAKDPEQQCTALTANAANAVPEGVQAFRVYSLNAKQKLLEGYCWRGAYNEGYGYWVMNQDLSQIQQVVTLTGSNYQAGLIDSAQKGRGLGDCWLHEQWVWNGTRFVQSLQAGDYSCKGFAGGAWNLVRLRSHVKP